eukprot:Skav226414  [mRNA]  locus=scaffold3528:13934:24652:+ [translate_table: standard]
MAKLFLAAALIVSGWATSEWRKLAYAYGRKLLPRLGAFESLYYALGLNSDSCHVEMEAGAAAGHCRSTTGCGWALHHMAAGSEARPVRSLHVACDRAIAKSSDSPMVVLRAGTHFLTETLTFKQYEIGVGGECSIYDPPVSFWCSADPKGGGAVPGAEKPAGVTYKSPNGPYEHGNWAMEWRCGEDAQFFVWRPARWFNWIFDVAEYDRATNNFTFGRGGHQGARGFPTGGDFFVENVMEELDYPGEFFFDKRTEKLYLFYNGTGAPPTDSIVAPQVQVLVNITGTQWNPVKGVQVKGLHFSGAAPTYMMPYGVPSGGDWALDRYSAVFLQGTEETLIDGCTFERLDGNAVMVSGYNRDTTIQQSDFAYLGGNAVAVWGYTNETSSDPGRPGIILANAPQAGVDGTDGEHPVRTTMQTLGGDEIASNLVFSTCRESGDHGPFNSWDRQPFLTTTRTGEPSMIMQWRWIHHNFMVDNFSPQEAIDNDDGSCYYKTHAMSPTEDNVYAYVGKALGVGATLPGHEQYFYGNYVVMQGETVGTCLPEKQMYGNHYFTPSGKLQEGCQGFGGQVSTTPSDAEILAHAKMKLGRLPEISIVI